MDGERHTPLCDRSRQWASLALDSELSELEQRLLDAHLTRCVACARYAEDVSGVVAALRSAEQEPVPASFRRTARRARTGVPALRTARGAAAVAAAAAAGVAMFTLGASTVERAGSPAARPLIIDTSAGADTMDEVSTFREARRAQLLSVEPEPAGSAHPGATPL